MVDAVTEILHIVNHISTECLQSKLQVGNGTLINSNSALVVVHLAAQYSKIRAESVKLRFQRSNTVPFVDFCLRDAVEDRQIVMPVCLRYHRRYRFLHGLNAIGRFVLILLKILQ